MFDDVPEGTPIHYLPSSPADVVLLQDHLEAARGFVGFFVTSTSVKDVTCQRCMALLKEGI